jgi:hypothetical protein
MREVTRGHEEAGPRRGMRRGTTWGRGGGGGDDRAQGGWTRRLTLTEPKAELRAAAGGERTRSESMGETTLCQETTAGLCLGPPGPPGGPPRAPGFR